MSLSLVLAALLAACCVALGGYVLRLRAQVSAIEDNARRESDALRRELSGLERGWGDLERLSATDPLTGVWNYRYLHDALTKEIERAKRRGRPLSVLMLDIDRFRAVTDAYGHQRGNMMLRDLAQRLALEIRQLDTFARYGGEEFVLVLPDTPADGAARVADRIRYVVRKHDFGLTTATGEPMRITVSVGGAVFPAHGDHSVTLLRQADDALGKAKHGNAGDAWQLADGSALDEPEPPSGQDTEADPGVKPAVEPGVGQAVDSGPNASADQPGSAAAAPR
jgi:diguanylate cyclase (GGDEF)-like protein